MQDCMDPLVMSLNILNKLHQQNRCNQTQMDIAELITLIEDHLLPSSPTKISIINVEVLQKIHTLLRHTIPEKERQIHSFLYKWIYYVPYTKFACGSSFGFVSKSSESKRVITLKVVDDGKKPYVLKIYKPPFTALCVHEKMILSRIHGLSKAIHTPQVYPHTMPFDCSLRHALLMRVC